MATDDQDKRTYIVLVNSRSVLPLAEGSRRAEHKRRRSGRSKEECLAYIGTVWTDMRPRSLRSTTAAEAAV